MKHSELYIPLRLYTLTLAMVLASANILNLIKIPAKYYFDSNTIQAIASGQVSSYGDKSYGAIAKIVRTFQLNLYPNQSKFVTLCLFLLVLQSFVLQNKIKENNLLTVFLLTCLFVIGSVYFQMYTKEIIPLFLNSILIVTCQRFKSRHLATGVFVLLSILYGMLFRSYWLITMALLLCMKLMQSMKLTPRSKTITMSSLFAFMIYIVSKYNPGNLSSIQQDLNRNRIGSEFANSALINYPDYLPESLYWPYRMVALFFPFILIQKLNIQSLLFGLFLCLSAFLICKRFYKFGYKEWKFDFFCKYLLSHFVVLSLFEPDYGSFVKHVTPFFVIFAYLITYPPSEEFELKLIKKVER